MITNPKLKKLSQEQNGATPEQKNAHEGVPPSENEKNPGYPQANPAPNSATPMAKTATPAAHGYTESAQGSTKNTLESGHGYVGFKPGLTMGTANLPSKLLGVVENGARKFRGCLPTLKREWVNEPPFAPLVIGQQSELREVVLLAHGAQRMQTGRGDAAIYHLTSPIVRDERAWLADNLAADMAYLGFLKECFRLAYEAQLDREKSWLKAKYRVWRDALEDAFRAKAEELTLTTRRHQAGTAKIAAGEYSDPEKREAAVQLVEALEVTIADLVWELGTYWPQLLPEEEETEAPECPPLNHFISQGGYAGICKSRGVEVAGALMDATLAWRMAGTDEDRQAAAARYKTVWFGEEAAS